MVNVSLCAKCLNYNSIVFNIDRDETCNFSWTCAFVPFPSIPVAWMMKLKVLFRWLWASKLLIIRRIHTQTRRRAPFFASHREREVATKKEKPCLSWIYEITTEWIACMEKDNIIIIGGRTLSNHANQPKTHSHNFWLLFIFVYEKFFNKMMAKASTECSGIIYINLVKRIRLFLVLSHLLSHFLYSLHSLFVYRIMRKGQEGPPPLGTFARQIRKFRQQHQLGVEQGDVGWRRLPQFEERFLPFHFFSPLAELMSPMVGTISQSRLPLPTSPQSERNWTVPHATIQFRLFIFALAPFINHDRFAIGFTMCMRDRFVVFIGND